MIVKKKLKNMIIIKINNNTPIEKALKQFKSKVIKTKLMSEIKNRKEFTKKSVVLRSQRNNAIYKEKIKKSELN